jgi:antitoxin (DNA-binding transcriptional repressor) of toxin-antitoxin stability system
MKRVNMHDAKTHLSRYVSGLKGKESLIICNRNRPVAELRPLPRNPGKPRIGVAKGEFVVPEAFFEPLPDDILKAFGQKKSS